MKHSREVGLTVLFCALIFGSAFFVFTGFMHAAETVINATIKVSVCGNNIKENGEQCDGSDMHGRYCPDLGFSGGTLTCAASCEFDTAQCTTIADQAAAVFFPASTGGTYTLTDADRAATLVLPEDFSTQDVNVQMFADTAPAIVVAPAGKGLVGFVYNLILTDPNGEHISTIAKPATIILAYADADIANLDETTIRLYRRENATDLWELVSGAEVDVVSHTITFTTTTFSSFALFGSLVSSSTPTPAPQLGGGGGGGWIPVANTPTPSNSPRPLIPADINTDGKVDLKDFSILAYWWGRTVAAGVPYDLNHDGKITLADFSILAYYWTTQ